MRGAPRSPVGSSWLVPWQPSLFPVSPLERRLSRHSLWQRVSIVPRGWHTGIIREYSARIKRTCSLHPVRGRLSAETPRLTFAPELKLFGYSLSLPLAPLHPFCCPYFNLQTSNGSAGVLPGYSSHSPGKCQDPSPGSSREPRLKQGARRSVLSQGIRPVCSDFIGTKFMGTKDFHHSLALSLAPEDVFIALDIREEMF